MRKQTTIGTASLILIFLILCLSTFGLLSLSSARGDWMLTEKSTEAVKSYYRADAEGEAFVQLVHGYIQEGIRKKLSEAEREKFLKEKLGVHYQEGNIVTDIPMDFGQALHIELKPGTGDRYKILSWNVYNREDFQIDQSIPVWTGGKTDD